MTKQIIKTTTYEIDKPQQMAKMANILCDYVKRNNLSVNIAGKNYVMVEGWQFAGGMMGLFPKIVKVENTADGKWLAQADIIDKKTGNVMGTGFAVCSKLEAKKKTFDDYAILSMAQTRAIGKAYRNLIGWVMKMTGYESTPAEEMKQVNADIPVEKSQTNFKEQLKVEVFKLGAKTEKEAVDIINKKTGLKLTDLKLTEKHAEMVLFQFLKK